MLHALHKAGQIGQQAIQNGGNIGLMDQKLCYLCSGWTDTAALGWFDPADSECSKARQWFWGESISLLSNEMAQDWWLADKSNSPNKNENCSSDTLPEVLWLYPR